MNLPHPHPRRRYVQNTYPLLTSFEPLSSHSAAPPTINSNLPLRKSATFHSPSSPSCKEHDPILHIPSLPRRSPTCPRDLEAAITAGDDRLVHILGAVDRSLSGLESFSSDNQSTSAAEDFPIPRFMLNAHVGDLDRMDLDQESDRSRCSSPLRRTFRKHHTSDSGIGSTVTSSESCMLGNYAGMKQTFLRHKIESASPSVPSTLGEGWVKSGINGLAVSGSGFKPGTQHLLSKDACRHIQKYIILPIVREEKLKDFHPLVSGIPYRIARKEITCLRDLEKVLLWLAPKWSISKASFLTFCTTSIQCIHTTVEYLNENDQRRPTDRPYTNGYFLDLVEQVQQYAAMLATSRSTTSSDEPSEGSEEASREKLSLVGGLSQTGRPAELVRTKDGQSVSLRTGEVIPAEDCDTDYKQGLKRAVSEDSEDDARRSMARRRKSALPVVKEVQKCRECEKIFKRPCDLTKHEKTHSRPWKCNDIGCKYHEYGWPTEKERDRHVNDKHSATPSMYQCQYHPCPYESKRESNCKQHMEKAHGWKYVRSKNNGKNGKKPSNGKTPPTPQMSTPGSYVFDAPTPDLREAGFSCGSRVAGSCNGSLNDSIVASDVSASYMPNNPLDFCENLGSFNRGLAWQGSHPGLSTGNSHGPPWDSAPIANPSPLPSSFEASLIPQDEDTIFGSNFDWSNMDQDYTSLNIQLITPVTSVEARSYDACSRNPSISFGQMAKDQIQSLSPGAQGDAMLYSPYSNHTNDLGADETFGEYPHDALKPTYDFSLFDDSNAVSSLTSEANEGMFQELANFDMPSAWSGRGTDLAQHFGLGELMDVDRD